MLLAPISHFGRLFTINVSTMASIVMASFSISVEHAQPCSSFLFSHHPNYSVYTSSLLFKSRSTIMIHSFTPLAVALLLQAVLACESPDTHSCASIFSASTALVTSFCATYTASKVTSTGTAAIPSAISSACSGLSLTISEQCTCFVTPGTATTTATVSTVEVS